MIPPQQYPHTNLRLLEPVYVRLNADATVPKQLRSSFLTALLQSHIANALGSLDTRILGHKLDNAKTAASTVCISASGEFLSHARRYAARTKGESLNALVNTALALHYNLISPSVL